MRGNWGGVIITSANAAAAIAAHPARDALIKLPVFAVGKRSADAARAGGIYRRHYRPAATCAIWCGSSSRAAPTPQAPLLYLAGEDRAGDLIGELAVHGIAAEMAVVYRAVTAPFPPR